MGIMSGTPHAIKLVKRVPNDDFDGGKFALIWFSPKDDKFYVATKQSDLVSEYAIFTTDGVAERVYKDQNLDSAYNATETAVTAYFKQFTNTLYMSFDASCETGDASVEPCLQKGDLLFITDANWGKETALITKDSSTCFFGGATTMGYSNGFADTTDLYTITKIWKAEETSDTSTFGDKFRITVDKMINWDGADVADPDGDTVKNTGYVQILKFTPATTGTFTCVSQCSLAVYARHASEGWNLGGARARSRCVAKSRSDEHRGAQGSVCGTGVMRFLAPGPCGVGSRAT